MNKRILYIKDNNGNYASANYITSKDGIRYRVGFLGGDKKAPTAAYIKSADSDALNITLKASSHWKIKIKIKKALIEIGCVFDKETRKPRKILTEPKE